MLEFQDNFLGTCSMWDVVSGTLELLKIHSIFGALAFC